MPLIDLMNVTPIYHDKTLSKALFTTAPFAPDGWRACVRKIPSHKEIYRVLSVEGATDWALRGLPEY